MKKAILILSVLFAAVLFFGCGSGGSSNDNKTTYTVSFNGNGVSDPESKSADSGSTIVLPLISRDGYNFKCWTSSKTSSNCLGYADGDYEVKKNITLYAQWDFICEDNLDPWSIRENILASTFWVNEAPSEANGWITNVESAWDPEWGKKFTAYGSDVEDAPNASRDSDYFPIGYDGSENPYYFALPYNDGSQIVFDGDKSSYDVVVALNSEYSKGDLYDSYVVLTGQFNEGLWKKDNSACIPWYDEWYNSDNRGKRSIVKGRWIKVKSTDNAGQYGTGNGNWVYAQWLDAGPYHYDDFDYVFKGQRPRNENANSGGKSPFAGIDLSPAVMFKMGFGNKLAGGGINVKVDWQFVDESEVPKDGPWYRAVSDNKTGW